ncbi:MAG: TIR domain-containing protein [Candidatus Bathyarchaeia archaeon]
MEKLSTNRTRVFLSYASSDREIAMKIANYLKDYGFRVWFDLWELSLGDSIISRIEKAISSSDYFIILVSPSSVKSKWVQRELTVALHELIERDVIIIPILISDVSENEIPIALRGIQWLDLRKDFEGKINPLVKQIADARIDFSCLNGRKFEELVGELLKNLGFTNIRYETRVGASVVDIVAEYRQKDPFGVETTEIWLVETKFYKNERANLQSLHQLMRCFANLPEKYKVLLVTNSQLTSTAKNWLENIQDKHRFQMRVIEGPELKRLLLNYPDIVQRYFAL